jgi:hypothetical protein
MLGPGRYLLGVVELGVLVGFAILGAASMRKWLLPRFFGAPAYLATAVIALALLIGVAEVLGTASLFESGAYLVGVATAGLGIWALGRRAAAPPMVSRPDVTRARGVDWMTLTALGIAVLVVIRFAGGARLRLSTGMSGFDSTWYHGPFASGFFQSGNTIDLHFIAPQFLAWFYPANGEIFHAVGMLAFGRDILSPLLNVGWFVGCLFACWCIGRPYRVAPWSLALGAIALSVPALADQAGEARNDIVGIFFLLAAVAVALNAWAVREGRGRALPSGTLGVAGLAAGLAAGTKLNFLLPAAVLVLGLVAVAPRGGRLRALGTAGLAALAGGGYWYLRNLVHSGNPLPWVHHLGPISLPGPGQALGGREAHGVVGYLSDGGVWSDWFLPGLHDGLSFFWPLLGVAALAGLLLCLLPVEAASNRSPGAADATKEPRGSDWSRDPVLPLAALVGLATALAWLVAPTSASGPEGMPRGFESGLRYLTPALVLGLALLPAAPLLRSRLARLLRLSSLFVRPDSTKRVFGAWAVGGGRLALGGALALVAVGGGYLVQRHYLADRYSDPTFTTPGLDAAFEWANGVSGARIATTSTRQYPLFGTDLSNQVQFVGLRRPHGGFEAPSTCPAWRRALNAGHYDYVVTSRDRLEPGKSPYPPQARWASGLGSEVILKVPPTIVYKLKGPLDPQSCPS